VPFVEITWLRKAQVAIAQGRPDILAPDYGKEVDATCAFYLDQLSLKHEHQVQVPQSG